MINLPIGSKKKKSGGTTAAFLTGSIIGAVGAYFFLTEKGKAQRKDIADAARDYSTRIAEQVNNLKLSAFSGEAHEDAVEPVVAQTTQESTDTVDKAHNMVSHLKKTATDTPGTEPV